MTTYLYSIFSYELITLNVILSHAYESVAVGHEVTDIRASVKIWQKAINTAAPAHADDKINKLCNLARDKVK